MPGLLQTLNMIACGRVLAVIAFISQKNNFSPQNAWNDDKIKTGMGSECDQKNVAINFVSSNSIHLKTVAPDIKIRGFICWKPHSSLD